MRLRPGEKHFDPSASEDDGRGRRQKRGGQHRAAADDEFDGDEP